MTRAKTATQSWKTCSVAGCTNPWSSNFGRRLCSHHGNAGAPANRQPMLPAMPPLREAVRPYSEPSERDEEYVHDDRA